MLREKPRLWGTVKILSMLTVIKAILSFLRALVLPKAALALEVAALRQKLGVFQRQCKRPKLTRADRAFWVLLSKLWNGWERAFSWSSLPRSSAGAVMASAYSGATSPSRDDPASRGDTSTSSGVSRPTIQTGEKTRSLKSSLRSLASSAPGARLDATAGGSCTGNSSPRCPCPEGGLGWCGQANVDA